MPPFLLEAHGDAAAAVGAAELGAVVGAGEGGVHDLFGADAGGDRETLNERDVQDPLPHPHREFLYNLHRLNVATSRARCVAAIVASPRVALVRCRTPRQMRLANALARFLELDALAAESVGG